MTERFDAIVVGAGHNGLVCAAYLARAGLHVVCLEAAEQAGGMAAARPFAGEFRSPGLAHVAPPVSSAIRQELGLDRHGYAPGPALTTVALDAGGEHRFLAGNQVDGEGLATADAEAYTDFRRRYLEFARSLHPLFGNRPPRLKDMDFTDKANLAKLGWKLRFGLGKKSMYEFLRVAAINIYDVLDEVFEDDRLKGALSADAVLGSGMGPRTPGTVLTWLQRLNGELNGQLHLQNGDDSGLTASLVRAAESGGAEVRCGTAVERILVDADRATGVQLESGEQLQAPVVVSGADPRATLLALVGAPQLDAMFANRVAQIRGAGVVAKLHLGLRERPTFADLDDARHGDRLLIAPTMQYVERAFNHAKYGECSNEPVFEITIPSLHNEALAPPGQHVMSVNVAYVPYALEGGWDSQKDDVAKRLIATLDGYAPGLKSLVVGHEFLTPRDIEAQYGAVQGHWHHGELTIHQSFMMRPVYGAAQYDTPIDGLFLCSAGCHPGGGLSGQPGHNAAKRIVELEKGR